MDAQTLQQKTIVNTYVNRGLTLVKGEGVFLYDEKGEKYLDLMGNYGVNIFGYNHPVINKKLIEQVQTLTTLHGSFTNDVRAQASEALIKRCGEVYAQVYWSNSGAEAIEAALKFAVLATQKKKFIVCDHGYHGKTLGALSATAGEKYKQPFAPLLWEFVQISFNDVEALEKVASDQVAGFIVEPIQGEGGIYRPDENYLKRVREICDQHGMLLILDEIQTGAGRTGEFLASQASSVSGDIVCLGKGLAGGIPIGATVVSAKVGAAVPKHMHTSTFGGNPLACAGVLATLELLTDDQLAHVRTIGEYFFTQLKTLMSPLVGDVRGQGLMLGLVVKDKRNQLLKLMQDRKILVIPAGEDVIRFLPPFILEKEHVDMTVRALQEALQACV